MIKLQSACGSLSRLQQCSLEKSVKLRLFFQLCALTYEVLITVKLQETFLVET